MRINEMKKKNKIYQNKYICFKMSLWNLFERLISINIVFKVLFAAENNILITNGNYVENQMLNSF